MNKVKIIVALICVVIVVVAAIFVVRLMGSLMVGATEMLGDSDEVVVPAEETWIAPTMPPQSMEDIDVGLAGVVSDTMDNRNTASYETDDEMVSVPVEETPDQLADTTPIPGEEETIDES